jgi:radical SAM protein with 4Fe4S-binding SPASM domain
MNCIHCRNGKLASSEITELTYEECIRIFHEAHELGCESINIGGGEPLLHKDVYKIINYVSKYCYTSLLTNGYIIDDEIAHKLKKTKVDMVQISLDSSTPEKHNKIRNSKNAYLNVRRAVEALTNCEISTCFMVTVSNYNIDELEEILKFATELKVTLVNFRRLIPQGSGNLNFGNLNPSFDKISKFLEKVKSLETQFNIGICLFPFFSFKNKNIADEYLKSPLEVAEGGCSAGVTGLSVSSNGNIQLCPHIPISLGNIKNDVLYKIWFENYTILKLRNRKNLKGKCGICKFNNVCGGCRAYPHQLHDDLLMEDSLCTEFRASTPNEVEV